MAYGSGAEVSEESEHEHIYRLEARTEPDGSVRSITYCTCGMEW